MNFGNGLEKEFAFKDKIVFLVKTGRRSRMNQSEEYPTEFFYGHHELFNLDLDVAFVEDADIGMAAPRTVLLRLFTKLSILFGGLPVGMTIGLLMGKYCNTLNDARSLVATTNGMGMALAIARALGQLKCPVVLLAMGLLPENPGWWSKLLYRWLVRYIKIVCISKGEAKFLAQVFPNESISYVPFGIDKSFWSPSKSINCDNNDYILAIGNDSARDWKTLVKAWKSTFPTLKLVTKLAVPEHGRNIVVVNGDWHSQLLSDKEVLKLYREALFVIVPLHDTIQPAGQSVCLQAMACAKAVIMSKIAGLWDSERIKDREHVLFVPPNDPEALESAVRLLISNLDLRERIASQGHQCAIRNFNTNVMAESLRPILEEVGDL